MSYSVTNSKKKKKKKKEKEKKIITKDNDIVTEWKLVGNLQ